MILEVGLPFSQAGPGAGRLATGLPRSTTSESVSEEDIYTCKKKGQRTMTKGISTTNHIFGTREEARSPEAPLH